MALPGTVTPAAPTTQGAPKVVPVIPFTRAALTKSAAVGSSGPTTLGAAAITTLQAIQIPPSGFLRRLKVNVSGVTAGNAAAVVFNGDGPFNVLQQISVNQPNGTPIYQPIDGFDLYVINKYFAMGTDRRDPLADPNYSVTAGAGATGGSFNFNLDVPFEMDERDGLGALMNMVANSAYAITANLAPTSTLYTTAPTTAPAVTLTWIMEYYSAPAPSSGNSAVQQVAPTPNGSLVLIQTQTPIIAANATGKFKLTNVGNVVRALGFIARTAAGVRTETDWPATVDIKWLGDVRFHKTKQNWRKQMADEYGYTAGITATPTLNSLDNGVYILTDFMNAGSSGNAKVSGGANRDRLLITNDASLFEFEAITAWGATASTLKILWNLINPSSLEALFHPFVN